MIIGEYPFQRFVEPDQKSRYQKFLKKIIPCYNLDNFEYTYLPKIYQKIDFNEYDFLEIYVFELLNKWVLKNEAYNFDYVNKFQRLINFLEIENKFGFEEKAYLEKITGIEFILNRKLKVLIPHFDMLHKEATYFFYEDLTINYFYKGKLLERIGCNLSITNLRLGFSFPTGCYLFEFKNLKYLQLLPNEIKLDFGEIVIELETNTPEVVYLSIDRIIAMEKYPI